MTTCAESLAMTYKILNITTTGGDTRDKIISAMNLVLLDAVKDRLDYYEYDATIDIPAAIDLTLTRTGAYTATYLSSESYFSDTSLECFAIEDGSYEARVIDVDTTTRTLTFNRAVPVTISSDDFTIYPQAYNLNESAMPFVIDGNVQTSGMFVTSIHGVYIDGTLIGTEGEYYSTSIPSNVPESYRWQAPYIYFNCPTSAGFTLHIKLFRQPKMFDTATYSASSLLDWPQGWDYYFALLTAQTYALLERDDRLFGLLEAKLVTLRKSFLEEQNSLQGSLYGYYDNINRSGMGRRDRTLR